MGGGLVVAAVVIGLLIWTGAVLGSKWLGSVWWICAAIFYAVLVVMYTTFFTNIVGLGSGMWRSLGYWLAQQGVARGEQPIYYYLIITPLYEFLPLIFGIAGGVYYVRRRDRFGQFLVFWALATFVLYTYLSEKMPWLLVNLTLPLILISGKFLADMVKGIEWRRIVSSGGLLIVPGVPAFLLALWYLAYLDIDLSRSVDVLQLALWAVVAVGLAATGFMLARRLGYHTFWSFAALPLAVVLLAFTVWTAGRASYVNGDVPVEMIVYTQTSPGPGPPGRVHRASWGGPRRPKGRSRPDRSVERFQLAMGMVSEGLHPRGLHQLFELCNKLPRRIGAGSARQ